MILPSHALNKLLTSIEFTEVCWLWTGEINATKQGYPAFRVKIKGENYQKSPRILLWSLTYGEPEGRLIVSCGNVLCLRHLTLKKQERCARGHLMAETRIQTVQGSRCSECKRAFYRQNSARYRYNSWLKRARKVYEDFAKEVETSVGLPDEL